MIRILLGWALFFQCIPLTTSCTVSSAEPDIVFVGSTPGDGQIKSMLSISAATPVDFIRWTLTLRNDSTFNLNIAYGESQPNTLGFRNGGQKKQFQGSFALARSPDKSFKRVYQLKSSRFGETISLVKLNENLLHILNDRHQLMIGNGGWSYSLNRTHRAPPGQVMISSSLSDKRPLRIVFDGRTPCQEISREHPEMKTSEHCFKLKWRLILFRDSVTHLPATCSIRKVVDGSAQDVSGTWTILNDTSGSTDVVIYKIETVQPEKPILFLVGDDHVLFFLDEQGVPFVGNENFSFALNRRADR